MSATTQLMTAEELLKLPHGCFRYELVKGELLTMSPAGEEHGAVSMNLAVALGQYVKENKLGVVYGSDTGFKLESDPDTVLAPDVAFIRRERLGSVSKKYREGAPDLAVEVISPNERQLKIERKIGQWLSLGARAVWIINPQTATVSIYRDNGDIKLLTGSDILTGDDLVPGFQISLSDIFSVGNF